MKLLLLNADNSPIKYISLRKTLSLIRREKVTPATEDCIQIKSVTGVVDVCKIWRLNEFQKYYYTKRVKFRKKYVWIRDKWKCAYCGESVKRNPTIDHIIPKSKGGRSTYDNVVTACGTCNAKKGSKSIKEAGYKLRIIPTHPTISEMMKAQFPKGI